MKKFRSFMTMILVLSAVTVSVGFIQTDTISEEKMRLFPITNDFRNYFFLQSVDDSTIIIIGDFTGAEKLISMIEDRESDNKIDRVIDYFPDTKNTKKPAKSQSRFFNSDLKQLKMDIIDGTIFKNYSYEMKSLKFVKFKLEDGSDIRKNIDGYKVTFFDPDATTTIMSEFFFGKKLGRYDLMFKTNYYKLFNTKIHPPLEYSVYCKNSKDPVVAEVVESLLKMVPK